MSRIVVDQVGAFALGQPAGDLVEQQQARLGGERARQLQPLALEQRQRAGAAVGGGRSPVCSSIAPQALDHLGLAPVAAEGGADQQVLEDGEVLERLRDLEGAGDAGAARAPAAERA